MFEPRIVVRSEQAARSAAERPAVETAIIAGRLAEFLDALPPAARDALHDDIAFLRAMAVTGGEPPGFWHSNGRPLALPEAMHPFDRLIDRLDLSPMEIDLLLLAGMAEEHEGYARVFRALHPRAEPRPTIGLAAQVFCDGAAGRRMLRHLAERGPAVSSGALVIAGDGPFPERALSLAESLWPVLHEFDVWPASLQPLPAPAALAGLDDWLAAPATQRAWAALQSRKPRLIAVIADSENVAAERACALAHSAGVAPARLLLPASGGDAAERLVTVHAAARDMVPVLQFAPADMTATQAIPEFRRFPGPVMVCTRLGAASFVGARPIITLVADRLSSAARHRLWRAALP